MKAMIKAVACAVAMFAASAQAAPLFTDATFAPGSSVVTFSEVALASGTAVTSQFTGVTFATNGPGSFYIGNGTYAAANPVSGNYLDSFSGGTRATIYDIIFNADVSAAGAFWEFNAPSTTKFTALNNGVAVDSFIYSNVNCCSSAEFLGFQGLAFDTIRVSNISGNDFYMDKLTFTAADVPEPTGVALFGVAALGLALARRRKTAAKAA